MINKGYIVFGISLLFALVGCEEVVDIEVPTSQPRLVIDAMFNKFIQTDNPRMEGSVHLSLSAPFFSNEILPALGAEVRILDSENGLLYNFQDFDNTGVYLSNFVPEFDTAYTLEIIYEGETYSATEYMMPTAVIESLVQGDEQLFNPDDKEVAITIKDDPDQRNFYYFNLDMGNYLTSDDEFYNGNSFPFSYFYEDLVVGDLLNIQVFGTNQNFTNFFEILLAQSGEDGGGGPFATAPATVRGNMINQTKPSHYPFGYFQISEGYEQVIEISK